MWQRKPQAPIRLHIRVKQRNPKVGVLAIGRRRTELPYVLTPVRLPLRKDAQGAGGEFAGSNPALSTHPRRVS